MNKIKQSNVKKAMNFFIRIYNLIKSIIQEIWFAINNFLKETARRIITKKIIDNILFYSINILLVITISYAGYQLFTDILKHFCEIPNHNEFPFILNFSEHLFLYFLPIFILFGLLNYYDLEWKRLIDKTNKPNPNAKNYLNLSKKLFFSSLLSYTSLKIIERLFFNSTEIDHFQMFYIGIFFIALIIFVLVQHSHE